MSFVSTAGARMPHGPVVPSIESFLIAHWSFNDDAINGPFDDIIGNVPALDKNVDYGLGQVATTPSRVASPDGKAADVAAFSGMSRVGPNEAVMLGGAQPYCIEARVKLDTASSKNGGSLIAKNFFASEPSAGVFSTDWGVNFSVTLMEFAWSRTTGAGGGSVSRSQSVSPPDVTWFRVAVADDLTSLRFYVDEALVHTFTSPFLEATPLMAAGDGSTAGIALFGSLSGFLGSTPNWSQWKGFVDYIKVYRGTAKHTGATMVAG